MSVVYEDKYTCTTNGNQKLNISYNKLSIYHQQKGGVKRVNHTGSLFPHDFS